MQFLYMQATCQSTPRAAQNPICCILCSRNILGLFSSCPPRARRRHERAPCCRPATHGAAFPAFIASKSLNPSYLPHVAIRQRFREPRQHANAGRGGILPPRSGAGCPPLRASVHTHAERPQMGQNSIGSVREFMPRSCGTREVPYVASSEKAAILPKTSARRRWPLSTRSAGAHPRARPPGACREPVPGTAEKHTALLAIYGALRADLDPRYPGSRKAPGAPYTASESVGFFGLASHWYRCTYDCTSGTRWAGATSGSPWPRRRLGASSSGTNRQPLPSP